MVEREQEHCDSPAEVGTVAVDVVAGVGGGRGLALAQAAALGAARLVLLFVARFLRDVGAVGIFVLTGSLRTS